MQSILQFVSLLLIHKPTRRRLQAIMQGTGLTIGINLRFSFLLEDTSTNEEPGIKLLTLKLLHGPLGTSVTPSSECAYLREYSHRCQHFTVSQYSESKDL